MRRDGASGCGRTKMEDICKKQATESKAGSNKAECTWIRKREKKQTNKAKVKTL